VAADPPGATDYRSEVVALDPPTPTIEARIVGGDSFLEFTVAPGADVVVLGYQGEEMIWFRTDGTVWENRNAPSTYLNADRLGGGAIPEGVGAETEPDWRQVAGDGHWAWHDHRTHWMQSARPVGFEPGDRILDASVPLVVDGVDTDLGVTSTWLPSPSRLPVVAGVLLGAVTAGAAWLLRHRRAATLALVPVVALAIVAGVWQFTSLPVETGPRMVWWALPVLAGVCTIVGIVAERRGARFVADGAVLVVGAELLVWGAIKRSGLSAAIVPSAAPGWFDRVATAGALTAGAAVVVMSLWWLFGPVARPVSEPTEPMDSPLPAHR
jgi:uncharacterized membrane protein (UPF0136 family)